tara:strand:+ start:5379 stop:5642 length:264 start_codon:yes stop_codon:yes gene_type:complete
MKQSKEKYLKGLKQYFESKLFSFYQHDLMTLNEVDIMLKMVIHQADLKIKVDDVYTLYEELFNETDPLKYSPFKLADVLVNLTVDDR